MNKVSCGEFEELKTMIKQQLNFVGKKDFSTNVAAFKRSLDIFHLLKNIFIYMHVDLWNIDQ